MRGGLLTLLTLPRPFEGGTAAGPWVDPRINKRGGKLKKLELKSHHHGYFGDYFVQGFRYADADGEIAWHTISYSNNSHIHHFWVANGEFLAVSIHYGYNSPDEMRIETHGSISNVNPDEKKAVLDAIAEWEFIDASGGDAGSLQ